MEKEQELKQVYEQLDQEIKERDGFIKTLDSNADRKFSLIKKAVDDLELFLERKTSKLPEGKSSMFGVQSYLVELIEDFTKEYYKGIELSHKITKKVLIEELLSNSSENIEDQILDSAKKYVSKTDDPVPISIEDIRLFCKYLQTGNKEFYNEIFDSKDYKKWCINYLKNRITNGYWGEDRLVDYSKEELEVYLDIIEKEV